MNGNVLVAEKNSNENDEHVIHDEKNGKNIVLHFLKEDGFVRKYPIGTKRVSRYKSANNDIIVTKRVKENEHYKKARQENINNECIDIIQQSKNGRIQKNYSFSIKDSSFFLFEKYPLKWKIKYLFKLYKGKIKKTFKSFFNINFFKRNTDDFDKKIKKIKKQKNISFPLLSDIDIDSDKRRKENG